MVYLDVKIASDGVLV